MDEEKSKIIKEQKEIEKQNFEIINEAVKLISHYINEEEYYRLIELIRKYRKEIYNLKIELKDDLADAYAIKETVILEELDRFTKSYENLNKLSIAGWIVGRIRMKNIGEWCEKFHEYPIKIIEKKLEKANKEYVSAKNYENEQGEKHVVGYELRTSNIWLTTDLISTIAKFDTSSNMVEFDESAKKEVLSGERIFTNNYPKILLEVNEKVEENINRKVSMYRENQIVQYYEQELEFFRNRILERTMGDIEVDYE